MSELRETPEVLYGGILALLIVLVLTPAVGGVARRLGAVDIPARRRLNELPIPRLGGIALFLGILVPALAFVRRDVAVERGIEFCTIEGQRLRLDVFRPRTPGKLRPAIVQVHGGGFMGRAFASAVAISRAMTGQEKGGKDPREHPFTKSIREEIRKKITEYDRHLLSGDSRQSESKKFGGPGARRRKQKSYR